MPVARICLCAILCAAARLGARSHAMIRSGPALIRGPCVRKRLPLRATVL
jgi:hypothetical protein